MVNFESNIIITLSQPQPNKSFHTAVSFSFPWIELYYIVPKVQLELAFKIK